MASARNYTMGEINWFINFEASGGKLTQEQKAAVNRAKDLGLNIRGTGGIASTRVNHKVTGVGRVARKVEHGPGIYNKYGRQGEEGYASPAEAWEADKNGESNPGVGGGPDTRTPVGDENGAGNKPVAKERDVYGFRVPVTGTNEARRVAKEPRATTHYFPQSGGYAATDHALPPERRKDLQPLTLSPKLQSYNPAAHTSRENFAKMDEIKPGSAAEFRKELDRQSAEGFQKFERENSAPTMGWTNEEIASYKAPKPRVAQSAVALIDQIDRRDKARLDDILKLVSGMKAGHTARTADKGGTADADRFLAGRRSRTVSLLNRIRTRAAMAAGTTRRPTGQMSTVSSKPGVFHEAQIGILRGDGTQVTTGPDRSGASLGGRVGILRGDGSQITSKPDSYNGESLGGRIGILRGDGSQVTTGPDPYNGASLGGRIGMLRSDGREITSSEDPFNGASLGGRIGMLASNGREVATDGRWVDPFWEDDEQAAQKGGHTNKSKFFKRRRA